jgi:hypothetical protein
MSTKKPISRRKAIFSMVAGLFALVSFFYLYKWIQLRTYHVDRSFFDRQFALISAITEVILPETDSPGAISAGVPSFVLRKIQHTLSEEEQRIITLGLDKIDRVSYLRFGMSFTSCNFKEQTSVIQYLEWKEFQNGSFLFKAKRKIFGNSFFYLIKQMTVEGYCLSQKGVTLGLAYDPIPGEYLACIPYQPNQKAWAQK